jgi:HlyD family secretion protein
MIRRVVTLQSNNPKSKTVQTHDPARVLKPALRLIILLFFGAGCTAEKQDRNSPKEETAARSTLDRVTAGSPARKTMRLFTEQPARVEAFEQTPIQSKISGYIESVHCDIGDAVSKGQLLIRIRAPEYQNQWEQKLAIVGQAESEIKQAEANLLAARAAANSAMAMVVQAQASIARAQADYARWDSENQRMKQLVSRGSVTAKLAEETTSQFQAADAVRQEATASVESARARQQQSEADVVTAEADVDAAKAKLRVVQAELQQAQTMLTYTELNSPFDGYVTSRHVDSGHYVHPGNADKSVPLLTIANLSKVRVFVQVPESEAPWVDAGFNDAAQGDIATILASVLPRGGLQGRVARTSLQIDPQSRSLTAEIDVDNRDLKLLPGAYVTARILLEERSDALTLPTTAIVQNAGKTVCCIIKDGRVEHCPIELGLRAGEDVQILSGLNGDETVVLTRANSLQPGQMVEVVAKK